MRAALKSLGNGWFEVVEPDDNGIDLRDGGPLLYREDALSIDEIERLFGPDIALRAIQASKHTEAA